MFPAIKTASLSAARPLRILFLDDDPNDVELEVRTLERAGYACTWERVDDRTAFLAKLDGLDVDIVLADYRLPGFDGLAALKLYVEHGASIPFVLVSGTLGEELAIEALRAGATDYVLKTRLSRLVPVVQRALAEHAERRERIRAEAEVHDMAEVTSALTRVSRTLIENLNTPGLMDALCRVSAEELGADVSHTMLRDPRTGHFRSVANYGSTAEETVFAATVEIPADRMRILLSRLSSSDVADVGTDAPNDVPDGSEPLWRMKALALRRGADVIGVLVLRDRDRDVVLTKLQQRVAAGLAQLASMALSQAQLMRDLEQANRVKNDFIATMSHELRTPLHIIMGYTDLLLTEGFGPVSAEQTDSLKRIEKSASRLRDLIEWTLDLSRLDENKLPLRIEPVDFTQLVSDVVSQVKELRRRPDVKLTSTLPIAPCFVSTDRRKATVIVQNLVDNALKFTLQGSVTVELTRPGPGALTLTVADTGVGIASQDLERIFDPFVQLDDVLTHPYGGAGLGLHVVRRFVDALGGELDVQSAEGVGSRFSVTLRENSRRGRENMP
jgi:signal transduction histidine kinase